MPKISKNIKLQMYKSEEDAKTLRLTLDRLGFIVHEADQGRFSEYCHFIQEAFNPSSCVRIYPLLGISATASVV
jgi:hypothetical protein